MTHLKEGDIAPEICTKPENTENITLEKLRGKKVILYFYPKDNTPGCTAEACNLRDNYQELKDMGFEIIGVSPDSQKSHDKFADKHNLPFKLIPDPDLEVLKAYGVGTEKNVRKDVRWSASHHFYY